MFYFKFDNTPVTKQYLMSGYDKKRFKNCLGIFQNLSEKPVM